jgi:hypothetical protein
MKIKYLKTQIVKTRKPKEYIGKKNKPLYARRLKEGVAERDPLLYNQNS